MNTQTNIYVAAAAIGLLIVGILAGHLWSSHKIRRLEQTVETAKAEAAAKQDAAAETEKVAEQYKQKIDYLESNLAELCAIANKQDEELEKLTTNSNNARNGVERARRVRSIAITNEELCRKLAELGYACD